MKVHICTSNQEVFITELQSIAARPCGRWQCGVFWTVYLYITRLLLLAPVIRLMYVAHASESKIDIEGEARRLSVCLDTLWLFVPSFSPNIDLAF